MPKDESIYDMSAEVFAEKHPEDVKAWKAEAAEKAEAAAQDAERQRFAALEKAFPNHLAFAAEQFKAGSTVEQAKVSFAAVLEKELEAERKARAAAEEKAAAAEKAPKFRASDEEPKDGDGKDGAGGAGPKTFMEAVEAYKKAHPDKSARDSVRQCAIDHAELYEKHRKGE